MTTYIQKKERVFREKGDGHSERSRNLGEMKRIGSCIDRRAWATSDEERRQHILEYKKAKASFGTYVPVDVLIDLVCATKNAEIEALAKRIEELEKLLEMYNDLDLTDEQKHKLQMMTAQMNERADGDADAVESSYDNSESTTYGVCVGQAQDTQTEGCADDTCTQTAANVEGLEAINIDFNIDGSAELEIDVEPVCVPDCGAAQTDGGSSDMKNLLAQKDREILLLKEQINKLQRQVCGQTGTTDLEKKLTHSQLALASAQQEKAQLAKAITSSKAPELLQLEEEIACLRSNPNLTPEQETEIIKKELDVLKRYCDQLSNIQEENDQLKLENDYLKAQFGDCGDIQVLKQRSAMLDNVTCERDNLQNEVKRLAGGMELLRRRSDAADQLEREKCQLQKELNDLNRARRQSDYDLELVRSENDDFQKTLESTRCDRDCLREKLTEKDCAYNELQRQTLQLQTAHQEAEHNCLRLQDEVNRLRTKAKEADVFRLERDRLQLRVEELSALEVEVLTLVEKVKNLSIERDVLKRQGCELHNIIADQEHEIKALLLHVDRLSQCVEKQQDKIRTALDELQCELEHTNFLLANSQEQLQNESQQRSCLAQLENDLRKTVADMKKELHEKETKIRSLELSLQSEKCAAFDGDIDALEEENQKLRERIQQLECVCAYRHVDEILETSKQAVGVVIDEIKSKRNQSPTNDFDDYMLEENKQLRKNSKDIQNLATERIDQLSTQLQDANKENENLRAKIEILKSATKGIQTDLKIYNSQLEDPMPSSESDSQAMEELKICRIANANLEMRLKCIQESQTIKKEPECTCTELKKELERCRATNAQIEMTMVNLNRVEKPEESKSIKDLQAKLELCRDANAQLETTIKCLRDKADTRVNDTDDTVIKIEEQLEVEMSVRKQLQQENCNLNAALEEKEELIKRLQQQGSAPMQTLYKPTTEFTSEMPLSSEEQELQALLNTLQDENKRLLTTIEVKDSLITKMQADMEGMAQGSQENKKLLIEIDQLKDVIQALEQCRPSLEVTARPSSDLKSRYKCLASVDYILTENDNLKKRVADLQNEVCDLKLKLIKKPTATTATNCSSKKTEPQKDQPCRKCPEYITKNAQLQKQLDESKNGKNSELCALRAEVKRLQDSKSGCQCIKLKDENIKLKKQIEELQEELNNFRKSVTKYVPPGPSTELKYSCSANFPLRSRDANASRSRSASRTNQQLNENMQLQVQRPSSTSLALSPSGRTSSPRNLPPATNEQLLIENMKLQAQMADLKHELLKFTCLLTGCEADSDISRLHQINADLREQVDRLKDEIRKLGLGGARSSPSLNRSSCGSEQKQVCSRLQLLLEENQRLKEYQEGDSSEVEYLKKMIVQQEYDVDRFRNENLKLQKSLQECEAMMCLPAEKQVSRTISSLKREIDELKCENECLRTCLKSTSPSAERSAISKLGSYTSNKDLRSEIEELRSQLESERKCSASRSAELELEILRNQHDILKKSFEELQIENTKVCTELCRMKDQQEYMRHELEELRRKLAEKDVDKCSLQGELEKLQNLMKKRLADATKEFQDRIRLLEDEKLRMKREQQELMERLEQSVNHCSAQESELEMEIQKLKNKIMQLERLNCSLETEFADCKEKLEKVAMARIKELEDKVGQLEDDKSHLEARLCKMAFEQDELTKKLQDKIREANEREIEMESELMKLRGLVKSLQDDNIDLEKQLLDAQLALERLQEEIQEKINALEQQLEKLSQENKKLIQEIEQQKCENGFLKEQINDLKENCSELENAGASNLQTKQQLKALQSQYANCMEENKRLLEEIAKIKKEKDDMKREITEMMDKLQICDVNLADSRDKEMLEALVKKMEVQLKNCDIKCKDTRQLDLELQRLLEENERLKKQCDDEKKALEEQFEKSLALLKEQYDRDLEFVRGRHSEGIIRLQDMHEDTVSDTVKEFEREIESLQRQLADLLRQKQLDDEIIQKQREEIEKLKNITDSEIDACRRECKEVRLGIQNKLQHCEEENTRLKAELEIAKKCCEELEKVKLKLEEERNKLKSNLNDVTRSSMEEVVKMRGSVDSILQKNEAEMAKMKDYLKNLEAELDKAKKDCENEKRRLNSEIDRLKAELEKAKKCCDELERLTASLESAGRKANFSAEQLQIELGKLQNQLDLLKDELASEKKRLGAEIDKLKAELEKALKCCEELETMKKNLAKDNSDLESEIDEQRRKCLEELERLKKFHEMNDKKYEDIIAQLRLELAEHKKCCEELEKVKRQLEDHTKMLKGAGDAEQKTRQDLLNLQKELENQKKEYELEIARLRRELEDKKRLEDELARLKRELAEKQKCCDDLELARRELEKLNASLQKAYANDSSKCEEELAKIKAELNNIRKQYDDEIARLKRELENCKNLVTELQKQKDDLENANKSLKSQLDKAIADNASQLAKLRGEGDAALKRLEDELARLKKELAAKQKCCDDLESLQKQLDAKNKELNAALMAGNKYCEDELAKLRKELENMRKKYEDELSKLKAELDAERKRAEEAMAKLRKELDDQKRRNDELENLKNNLEKQLREARSKCDENLDNCLEELAKLKKDLERNKKRYEDEIEKLKQLLAEKTKCCTDLENMKKELDKANKALQAARDEGAKRSADEINNLKKDLEDTVKRYEDKLAKLREEMAAERKQYEDEISRLKKELDKYKKCCDELDEVKLALQNEKMRLESEINKLKQDLQNEKDNRKRDIDDLNKELDKAKQCCKDLENAKKELESMMSRHEKDLEKMKKDYENQLTRCNDELADCRKKLAEQKIYYEAEIDKLKKEISLKEKCCEDLDTLKNNLLDDAGNIKAQYEDEINRLRGEIEKYKKCCEDLEEAKKQLANAKKDCEDQLKKLREEMEKLTARLKEVENEKNNLAAKLNDLQNKYNQLSLEMSDQNAANKALQDCRDQLLNEKKRCEMEIEKLKAEIERLKKHSAELEIEMTEMRKKYEDEIKRLKELVKKGEKCCEELERQKKDLKAEVTEIKDRKRNSRDSGTQQRASTRDSTTQDIKQTRDSISGPGPEADEVKVCPCGAIAKNRGIKLVGQREIRPSQQMRGEADNRRRKSTQSDNNEKVKKLDRLSKATALIFEVKQETCTHPRQFSLTKKSIIITNVEPSSSEVNKQLISLEEAKPVNLTKSMESILSKALKVGLENLTHEELKGLHSKTKDAVSTYKPLPLGKCEVCSCTSISESELALNKLPLQRRISQLENELLVKQKCACEKMRDLESTILAERQQMVEMKNKSMSEQKKIVERASKLGWENDSLKQQASFHEIRLQQLLAQIEQEKARSTSLKADLLKANAIEAQLIELIKQNKVQGQCAFVEGKLDKGSCAKAKMMQKPSVIEPEPEARKSTSKRGSSSAKRRSSAFKAAEDGPRATASTKSIAEEPDQDSSEGRGDEKKKSSAGKKGSKKK